MSDLLLSLIFFYFGWWIEVVADKFFSENESCIFLATDYTIFFDLFHHSVFIMTNVH